MADHSHNLSQLQTWLQSVIMHPGGVVEGIRDEGTQRSLAIEPEQIESVIDRSHNLTSVERLEIYARAYYARLIECLQAQFPMLARAVGDDLFGAFAVDYLRRYPSQSYTLGELGSRFVRFLQETRPNEQAAIDAAENEDAPWPDFLIDLAELEWHFSEVFDGPGAEQEPPLDANALAAIPPDRWAAARLTCVPCLRLVEMRYPVHLYWRALRDHEEAVPPLPAETWLAISRRNYIVRHLELSRPAFMILGGLQTGLTVGEAIGHAANALPADADSAVADLQAWFAQWSGEGFFRSAEGA